MADKEISDLTVAGALDGTEDLHVDQGGNSRQTSAQDIADLARTEIEKDGTLVGGGEYLRINFTGGGVSVSDAGGGEATVNIPLNGIEIEDEGVSLTVGVAKMNFIGAGVTVTEPVADEVEVTVPGDTGVVGRVVTASENLVANDFNGTTSLIVVNSGSDVVLTVVSGLSPTHAVAVFRKGAGEVDIAAGGGVTLLSENGDLSIDAQYNGLTIMPTGTSEEYAVMGKLKA